MKESSEFSNDNLRDGISDCAEDTCNYMEPSKLIYEGKAKVLFEYGDDCVVQHFKDVVTAFNNKVTEVVIGKGALNNTISAYLMDIIGSQGIETHFIRKLSKCEQLVKRLDMIPIEFVVRNVAAGSIVKRLGMPEGLRFDEPIIELFFKNDELGDPMINLDHALFLDAITLDDYEVIVRILIKLNDILVGYFSSCSLELVDFKVEFGRSADGKILLGDEISPDSCRLWDVTSKQKLDKDVFRLGIGNLIEAYKEIASRMGISLILL